jgi:hypothetical protein
MIRFLILAVIIIGLVLLTYKLLTNNNEKKTTKRFKWFENFNKPVFKIPIGVLIILMTLVSTFRLVKVLPIVMKIGIIAIDFAIIYSVIIYLFNNNKNKN